MPTLLELYWNHHMNTVVTRTQLFSLSAATIALLFVSNIANADIYKWRNNRGVIQYADKPPVAGFSKADRHEIVNSLQAKDLCAAPTAKIAGAAKKISANFFVRGSSSGFSFTRKPAIAFGVPVNVAIAPRPVVTLPIPVVTAPKPDPVVFTPKPTPVVTIPKPVPVATAPSPTPSPTPTPSNTPTSSNTPTPTPATTPTGTTPNILQSALMPAVDISKNVIPASGYSTLRVQATGQTTGGLGEGAFRIPCKISHMSNDDPIVYPNQKGAAHHHTFFGNTSTNYASNVNAMSTVGNSTCAGGIANRSAYWMPSLIDTATNTPISDFDGSFYYKTGYGGVPTNSIVAPPKGLRMISGNSKATSAATAKVGYSCIPKVGYTTKWTSHIQNCNVGDELLMSVRFPQCWDGKNLDSPDHISHMADSGAKTANGCPTTHPVPIPEITFGAKITIKKANEALNWRLASDNYPTTSPGGYSGHADWVNGWDEAVMAKIINNCIKPGRDCHSFLLGDGTTLF